MPITQPITLLTSDTIIDTGFDTYAIDATSNINITLPDITNNDGYPLKFIRLDISKFVVTLIPVNSQLINGLSSQIIYGLSNLSITSYNSNWYGSINDKQTIPYSSGSIMTLTTDNLGNPSNAGVLSFGSSTTNSSLIDLNNSIEANAFAYSVPYPGKIISLYATVISTLTVKSNVILEIYVATNPTSTSFTSTGFTLSLPISTIASGSTINSLIVDSGTRILLRVILDSTLPDLSVGVVVQAGILLI